MANVFTKIVAVQSNCRVFITKNNRFGYGYGHPKEGDQVCLLDGAPWFHLIRQREHETSRDGYELTGEAYLHHAMNGEIEGLSLESYGITLT